MEQMDSKKGGSISQLVFDFLCLNRLSVLALLGLVLLPIIPPFNREYLIRWLINGGILAISAMAFDLSGGYISIVNFGFMAFFGLGSYTSAILAINFGLSPWITMFIGALFSAFAGFLVGIMSLRLRGMFAIALTWFVGLALMGLATKLVFLTRGPSGLVCPHLFESNSNKPYFYTIIVMMLVTYVVLKWVVRSRLGLAFRALGQNIEAAKTSGINPTPYRVVNFTLSCAFAGWVGSFYAHYYGILTPDVMATNQTVEVMVVMYIGGRISLWGGAVAAFPFVFAMNLVRSSLSNFPGIHLVIYGFALILIMIYYPGGLAQLYRNLIGNSRNGFFRWLASAGTASNSRTLQV